MRVRFESVRLKALRNLHVEIAPMSFFEWFAEDVRQLLRIEFHKTQSVSEPSRGRSIPERAPRMIAVVDLRDCAGWTRKRCGHL